MRESFLHPSLRFDRWLSGRCGLAELTPESLAVWQVGALRAELRRIAEQSRFYQEVFARLPSGLRADIEAGRWPRGAATLIEDMAALPFTEPRHLEGENWRRFLCVSQDEVARMVTLRTSGTTGMSKRLAFTEDDVERTLEFFSVGMGMVARHGETVLILLPGAERRGGVADLLLKALSRPGGVEAVGVAGNPAVTADTFTAGMKEYAPDCLVAMPSQLERLLLGAPCRFRAVLSASEPLDSRLRSAVEQAWGCEVFDHYGLTESGYGGGVECPAHRGYHLREADLWVEIVDPYTGSSLPDGQSGEVVFTTLGRRAMPLARYRTGDIAAMLPGPCGCGGPLRRLGQVEGRLVKGEDGRYTVTKPQKGNLL